MRAGKIVAKGEDDEDEPSTAGWDAITAACEKIHGKQEPAHWGTAFPWSLGGPDPLDGASAFRVEKPPCWHYVSYGLSDLYDKESEIAEQSGWGFELTFRLARSTDAKPPVWPVSLLQNLARYVFQTRNTLGPGHHMPCNGPIAAGQKTDIIAIAFRVDPELGEIETPNGRVRFLQVVGLTDDELLACLEWDTDRVLETLARKDPLLVTDLSRRSMLEDPEVAKQIGDGAARDGSSCGVLFITGLQVKRTDEGTTLVVGAQAASSLAGTLRGRIPHGRELTLANEKSPVILRPGARISVRVEGDHTIVELPAAAAVELASALRPTRGLYRVADARGFAIELTPTDIKDSKGNVIRTIG
jgi:hypothetical protein